MFRHRLSKLSSISLLAICMLFVGGSLQSCQDWFDDYKYDDEEPNWLGASIYDFLKEGTPGHTYSNFVAIIDSLGETETLSHTGSKTLFVADDAAFEEFFKNNPWGVTSVGEMTKAQMKIILYSAMLDNAMLLDMMASTGAGSGNEGTCLRRYTSANVIDTIPLVTEEDMPAYNKYWAALNDGQPAKPMRLAMDGTAPMMVHFLYDYLRNNAIKASDIQFLFRKDGMPTNTFQDNEALVYGHKIVSSGVTAGSYSEDTLTITCKNGYIYRLDGLLLPPSNMAAELRAHEDTEIFSHLLDRFCVPVYDGALSVDYQAFYNTKDSIYRLRYLTDAFPTTPLLDSKNATPALDELLNFDPGWNEYQGQLSKERDMAAMFVPNDEVLYEYFGTSEGSGRFLLDQYAPDIDVTDQATLLQALDSVPEILIAEFLNNLMKPSFVGTVLSKFDKITDDANDPIGLEEHHVDECVIANNGVIYILNNVFGPASYQAVSAPTKVFENMLIMRNIIKQLDYDNYLLAMDAEYSFIVPDDDYFVYYDPITHNSGNPKAYVFHYNANRPKNTARATELWAETFKFDPKTYQIADTAVSSFGPVTLTGKKFGGNTFMTNRMTDLMEYLIILGDIESGNKYYQTKGYGTIKVEYNGPENIVFYGGEQIENGTSVALGLRYAQKNGRTYCTVAAEENTPTRTYTGVPTPPTRSVYTNMKRFGENETDLYYEFFQLCNPGNFTSMLEAMFPGADSISLKEDSLKLYSIFYNDAEGGTIVNGVPFFSTYHYTVYVPSNESIRELFDRGLPAWEQVEELAATHPAKAASVMRMLNKFIRYHFQDNSVYVDNNPFAIAAPGGGFNDEANFATSVINDRTGRFYETVVRTASDGKTLIVKDDLTEYSDFNNWARVITTGEEGRDWNVMCRDFIFTTDGEQVPQTIETSSFAVLQPINRALLNASLFGYDGLVRRFAATGELVDTMTVKGTDGLVSVGGKSPYLVASRGRVEMPNLAGNKVRMSIGYLMSPINEASEEWNEYLTREELVLQDNEPMLVNAEGMLVQFAEDEDGNVICEYVVDENNNMLKVDNSGNVIARIPATNSGVE